MKILAKIILSVILLAPLTVRADPPPSCRASRNLLNTALTSTKMECGFTRLRILKTANNRWVLRRSVVTGVTVSAGITKARVRTMVVFRAGSTERIH